MPEDKGRQKIDARFKRFDQSKQRSNSWATLSIGHSGKAKVLHYDVQTLVKSGAFLTALCAKGTVFSMDITVLVSVLTYVLIGGGSFSLSYFVGGQVSFDSEKLVTISNYLNAFMPFILSLYLALTLARWWKLRISGIGEIIDACQNMLVIICAYLPGQEFHELHDQIVKYAMASISLLVNSTRGVTDISNLGPKRDQLLTEEEVEIFENIPYRPRAAVMWCWIAALVIQSLEERGIPQGKHRDVTKQCVKARDAISCIWSHLMTQLPYAYVHLVIFIVNLNNLVVSLKCGVVLATDLRAENWVHAFSQVVFLVLVPLLYQGLLAVTYVINNPFGEDVLDFPVMAYQEFCNEASCSVSEYASQCPALGRDWGVSTDREIMLRRGFGKVEADAVAAGLAPVPDPMPVPGVKPVDLAAASAAAAAIEHRAREGLIEQALREQLRAKDEVITALQQQNKLIETSLFAAGEQLQRLEAKMGSGTASALLVQPSQWTPCQPAAQPKRLPPPAPSEPAALWPNRA